MTVGEKEREGVSGSKEQQPLWMMADSDTARISDFFFILFSFPHTSDTLQRRPTVANDEQSWNQI